MSDDATTPDAAEVRTRAPPTLRFLSVAVKDMGVRRTAEGAELYPAEINAADPRPATYGGCVARGLGTAAQPCPYVSCTHHLYLDVNDASGTIKLNFPEHEPDELAETCSLAVAAREGATLEVVAEAMALTRERVRQIESRALVKLARAVAELCGHDGRDAPTDHGSATGADALARARAWLAAKGLRVTDLAPDPVDPR